MKNLLIPLALLFCCCHNESPENQLIVSVEKISLRAAPGLKSAETAVLCQGEKLLDLGEVSHFESEITFDAETLRSPWLKVQTADNKQGWVFGGAVTQRGVAANWLLQKRLDCYFGHAFAIRLNNWEASLKGLQTAEECANAYRSAIALRDSIAEMLSRRAEPGGRPDYSWLAGAMPGFVYQRSLTGGSPNLFVDFRFWRQKAEKTSGQADDAFFETCLFAFPPDGIESVFPVWIFPVSETEPASQLGTGMHLKMLQEIDKTLVQAPICEFELMRLKDAVLEDIQDKNTQFWQTKALILKELDAIIAAPPNCLNPKERSALLPRRIMLNDAEKHEIVLGLRTGG